MRESKRPCVHRRLANRKSGYTFIHLMPRLVKKTKSVVWGDPTEGHFGPANAGVESSLWYKGVSSL